MRLPYIPDLSFLRRDQGEKLMATDYMVRGTELQSRSFLTTRSQRSRIWLSETHECDKFSSPSSRKAYIIPRDGKLDVRPKTIIFIQWSFLSIMKHYGNIVVLSGKRRRLITLKIKNNESSKVKELVHDK